MSLITRCPACDTLFKVVPDQLRISEGWVRCGHCEEVFDASLHLQTLQTASVVPAAPVAQSSAAKSPDTFDLDLNLDNALQADEQATGNEAPAPEILSAVAAPVATDALVHTAQTPHLLKEDLSVSAPESVPEPEPEPVIESSKASFLRHKAKAAAPRSRRVLMSAVLVLLALLLLGQVLLHERDRLVALRPELKPWVQTACQALGCRLSALRQIEAIVIESSSFSSIPGNAFRLSFTLKNHALTPLAIPAVELTLTDSLDQSVVRRVLMPHELRGQNEFLAATTELPVALTVSVAAVPGSGKVAGYRLLAFYP